MMKNPLNPPSLLQKHRGDSSKLLEITGLTPAEGEGSYQPHGLSSWSSTPSPSTTWIFEIQGAGGGCYINTPLFLQCLRAMVLW